MIKAPRVKVGLSVIFLIKIKRMHFLQICSSAPLTSELKVKNRPNNPFADHANAFFLQDFLFL